MNAIALGALPPVRLVHAGYLMVALTPAGQAVFAAVRGSPVDPVRQLVTGFAVTALFLWYYRVTRILTRFQRARTLQVEATVAVQGLVLVALTAEWLSAAWYALPWLDNHLFLPAVLLGLLEVLPLVTRGRYTPPGYTRLVTDKGFLFFALGGFFQPDPGLLTLASWLAAISAVHHWKMARTARLPLWHLRNLDAHRFLDGTLAPLPRARRAWLQDKVRPGRRPDLALVHTIAEQSTRLATDVKSSALMILHPSAAATRTGQAALDWLDHAAALLAVSEDHYGDRSAPAARAFDLARAHCAASRARVHFTTGAWERAAAAREAAALWQAHGLTDLAAAALADNALACAPENLAVRTLPPAEALRDLVPLTGERGLLPLIRQSVLLAAAACATLLGEAARANAWSAEAAASPPRRRDYRALNRLRLRAGLTPTYLPHLRTHHHLFEELPQTLAQRSAPRGLEPVYPPPLLLIMGSEQWPDSEAKRITDRGLTLWTAGHRDQASDEIERTATLFEETHRPLDARWVRYTLGLALYWTDPPRAYRNLAKSLDLQERIRDQVAGEDLRIEAGGPTEHLSAVIAWLLIHDDKAKTAHLPLARAFEFVERSRSRALLELLGQNLPLRAATELDELITAEQKAQDELARHRALLGRSADPQAALTAALAARERLNDIWDEIAATGRDGAEYAQFRRGEPVSFDNLRPMLAPDGHS